MTCAAILSLEDFRDTQRRAEIRQWLHDRFDHWLNQLEDRMLDRTPTLEELTQAVFALRQELTQAVTEGLVEHTHWTVMERRRFLRTRGANDARHIPENRGRLPENSTSCLRTAPPAHAW
jgi:hypothetical protein